MTNKVMDYGEGAKLEIYSPVVRGEKGTHKELIESLIKDGYTKARIDKELMELSNDISLVKNNKHEIDVLIDRVIVKVRNP